MRLSGDKWFGCPYRDGNDGTTESCGLWTRHSVAPVTEQVELWTIGHSNHEADDFLRLLASCGIDVLADVRSQPYARYASHFSQAPLRRLIEGAGLHYVFLGRELGGRPPEPEMYDSDDYVLYGKLANSQRFRDGLHRLTDSMTRCRVAMMCSEDNPAECHRRLLIARALLQSDAPPRVTHILGDGRLMDERQLSRDLDGPSQLPFFEEEPQWRSARSVSPNTPHGSSLAS